jgi:hypothetical protein
MQVVVYGLYRAVPRTLAMQVEIYRLYRAVPRRCDGMHMPSLIVGFRV